MADSKAQDLTKRIISSLASITGVRLWSGKSGDPDLEKAQGVELSELFSSAAPSQGSTVNYIALTPKGFDLGFNARQATEEVKGIVELASGAEVASETAGKVLQSDQQDTMRELWGKAKQFTEADNQQGRPRFYHTAGVGEGGSSPVSHKITVCFNVTKPDTTTKSYFFSPISGRHSICKITGIAYSALYSIKELNNIYINCVSGTQEVQLNSNNFKLVFPNTGPPYILITGVAGIFNISMDVWIIQ